MSCGQRKERHFTFSISLEVINSWPGTTDAVPLIRLGEGTVINERQYLSQVQKAAPRQFANILRTAGGDAERVLRVTFGDAQFERMQNLARNVAATPMGTVILVPGILGSELYQGEEQIWMSPWKLIRGEFDQFRLDSGGESVKNIQALHPLKKYYGEMTLSLLQRWNVVAFPYDWRLDVRTIARQLKDRIEASVPNGRPFSVIGHSLGGLVVRSYLQQFPNQLTSLQRFIMLGTPNYGSFAIPALYNGLNHVMKVVALLDQQHYMPELLQFAKTFMSTYQMLPFLGKAGDAARLMEPGAYGALNPPQQRFDDAKAFQREMAGSIDAANTTYIAGYGFKTPDGIDNWNKLQSWEGYRQTLAGDGTVPHSLGLIDRVTTYFVRAEHSSLPADSRVIQAVEDILATGESRALPMQMPQVGNFTQAMLQAERNTESVASDTRVHMLREIVRMERLAHPCKISLSETELQDLILTGASGRAAAAS
jgi:pimeloyl-ACP methyl ester carboxylesterase